MRNQALVAAAFHGSSHFGRDNATVTPRTRMDYPMLAGLLLLLTLAACDSGPKANDPPPVPASPVSRVPEYALQVVRQLPHDPAAYTQGLVFVDGRLYESTGRYGESGLHEIDPVTGTVLRHSDLPANVFGEGLAFNGRYLVQLSWKEFLAYFYEPTTFELVRAVNFSGEGWGLCSDGQRLFMTTGGDQLVARDPMTFDPISNVQITEAGAPLFFVNELECVADVIWGNVYPTTRIVKIDKSSGRVLGQLDASALIPAGVKLNDTDYVLNGIAYDPHAGTYYLTGKQWPVMFEVRITPKR